MGSRFPFVERSKRRLCALGLLGAWLSAHACAPAARTPVETLGAFRRAYAARDADALWSLLSPEARAHNTREQLARELAASDADTEKEIGTALEVSTRAPIVADVGPPEHRFSFVWVEPEKRWALRLSPLASYDLSTPRGALWALLHAVERRRWDMLISLAPAARRSQLTPEALRQFWTSPESASLRGQFSALRAALNDAEAHPMVELGPEAHFPFAEHAEVFLVKEEGLWRVEEIEAPEIPRD